MTPHPFEAVLAALEAFAGGDPRIEALWLQGSLAGGGADPFSLPGDSRRRGESAG